MAKENLNDGFVGVRFNTDWLREFKYKHPHANLSKSIRELMYLYYPLQCMNHYELKIKEKAKKQKELKDTIEKLNKDYEDVTDEIEFYVKKRDKPEDSDK